ncbi:MAG TPA: chemotaxis protein CheW [Kofleriaceae bacterium]|nr:chemotaxis protein CheW [Kofleriaceae bacterium]
MSGDESLLASRAEQLRRAFDDSFAHAEATAQSERVELLIIRVGPDPHAIRLSETGGVFADRRITRVPGPLPELAGLVSLRGALVPVYDLRLLLGYGSGPPLRWLVLDAGGALGLGFDQVDGHLVASPAAIVAEPGGANGAGGRARHVVELPSGGCAPLLSVAALAEDIEARVRRTRPPKERSR